MRRAGLVAVTCVALVTLAVVAVVAVFVAISGQAVSIFELRPGDCFELPALEPDAGSPTATLDSVDRLDCDDPHVAEVVGAGRLNPDQDRAHPGDPALLAEVGERCRVYEVAAEALGFGVVPVIPNESSWEPRGGRYLCVAVSYGGAAREGGIADRLVTSPLPGV